MNATTNADDLRRRITLTREQVDLIDEKSGRLAEARRERVDALQKLREQLAAAIEAGPAPADCDED